MKRLLPIAMVTALNCVPPSPSTPGQTPGPLDGAARDGKTSTDTSALKDLREPERPEVEPFTPHSPSEAIAQRLSRFVWNQERPPADLITQVEAASNAQNRTAIASAMLEDARARDGVAAFMRYWLDLDDLFTKRKPEGWLNDQLRQSMRNESIATANHVFFADDRRFETLLTAPFTFMDETLARHYGVEGVEGPASRLVPYGNDQRIGVFGGAGVLTLAGDHNDPTWPTMRFWYIGEALMCRTQGTGPFVAMGFPIDPSLPMRRQTELRTGESSCLPCHKYVNPLGFAFLRFDTVGRYRATDMDGTIDSSGQVPNDTPPDTFLPFPADLLGLRFQNQPELMRALAKKDSVIACFSRWVLNRALGRQLIEASPPPAGYDASLAAAIDAFKASGGDMKALWIAVAATTLVFAK